MKKRSVVSSAHLWVSTKNDICPIVNGEGGDLPAKFFVTGLNFVSAQRYICVSGG